MNTGIPPSSIVPTCTTEFLVDWLGTVQQEITEQCKLRSTSSLYFRQDILDDKTAREAEIIAELKSRGEEPAFTPYTQTKLTLVTDEPAE